KSKILVVGLSVAIRIMKNKKGQTMCFVTLDDRTGRIEASFYAETYDRCAQALQKDTIVAVEGVAAIDDYSGEMRFRASDAMSLVDARQRYAKGLELTLRAEHGHFIEDLKALLAPYRNGSCPVNLTYHSPVASTRLTLGEAWQVQPDDELLRELSFKLGPKAVGLSYGDS